MNFKNYFHEQPSSFQKQIRKKYDHPDHKIAVWNAFADSGLDGVNDDDFSILPRLVPESYLPVVEKTCKDITTFLLKTISLPESEMRAIIPRGPIRNFMLDELEVVKYRKKRITGSFRFDMAVVGKPSEQNPPKLLEVNEIGFDGLARSTFFQTTLLDLVPEFKTKAISLDTARAEVRNMNRLGKNIARIQQNCYNWDEDYLRITAEKMGSKLHLVAPSEYKGAINKKHFPLLEKYDFKFDSGKLRLSNGLIPDATNMSFAFTLAELRKDADLYRNLVRCSTPMYGPFITSLIATKTVLILLADPELRKKLLGSSEKLAESILPAFLLEGNVEKVKAHFEDYVIKHTDGCGGAQVFMNEELLKHVAKIPKARQHEWVVQEKTYLNTIDVNGILSRRKKAICDLGVFIHYDWDGEKFTHFEVGGLMSRATNTGLKVNVSSGGLQAAVLLEKGR